MKKPASSTLLVSHKFGRLGNRLVFYGHVIAFACEYGLSAANVAFRGYSKGFLHASEDALFRFPPRRSFFPRSLVSPLGRLVERLCDSSNRMVLFLKRCLKFTHLSVGVTAPTRVWDESFSHDVKDYRITALSGWLFRCPELFKKHQKTIRAFFKIHPKFEKPALERIDAFNPDKKILVGVHIRRGDYKEWADGRYYYSMETYRKWMDQVARHFGEDSVSFVICSSEPIDSNYFSGLRILAGGDSLYGDLVLMSACNYLFGPPSTFSEFSSFYGEVPLCWMRSEDENVNLAKFSICEVLTEPN
tara:strand:+ start:86009 stop:86917 length:909 start_codon:yes stop_codon:yes gene_type:complete